jgi:hypothetical protein
VNYSDPYSLRLLADPRHEQRLREADAERLAREISRKSRSRMRLAVGFRLGTDRRPDHAPLEA